MERPVKERLVGAAVLMAAAIILIPEMLSGPDRQSAEPTAESGEGAIKTYTIDLSQSPGSSPPTVTPSETDNRAPPPEEVAPAPTPSVAAPAPEQTEPAPTQVSPEPATQAPAVVAEERTPAPPPERQIAVQPARAEAPPPPRVETPPARPVASAPPAPISTTPAANSVRNGWAVQLGSYSSEATAERLMKDWRAKGQDAFVMPVKSGSKTLYRVRIGPTKDRAAAETALKAVKASVPGAAVVAHP